MKARKPPQARHETRGIRTWPAGERPREQLLQNGAAALSDAQLLGIILQSGQPRQSAVALAMELLRYAGSLQALGQITPPELRALHGIGPAKAAQVSAAMELGRRVCSSPLGAGQPITSSHAVARHYRSRLRDLKHETFRVLLLDAKRRLLREALISEGSLTASLVHPREAFLQAVRASAAAVIFVHNHPSGDPTPSPEDLELTQRLIEAGRLLGIQVLDHVIIGADRVVSLADQGLLSHPP